MEKVKNVYLTSEAEQEGKRGKGGAT